MSRKAWVQSNSIRDISPEGDPASFYHPDVAAFYDTEVPDGIVNGATLVAGVWTNPPPPPAPVPPTAAEIAAVVAISAAAQAQQIRAERDRLLVACDWTQIADVPVDKTAWAAYRQALRDVPTQAGFPSTIAWPTQPE